MKIDLVGKKLTDYVKLLLSIWMICKYIINDRWTLRSALTCESGNSTHQNLSL